jgi:hypothetical protein
MAIRNRTEEIKRIDALGRISLGKELANEPYVITRDDHGTIVLTPVAIIPKRELWLWENKEALAAVKEGLEQSARGEGKYIGSFAQYANDEVED